MHWVPASDEIFWYQILFLWVFFFQATIHLIKKKKVARKKWVLGFPTKSRSIHVWSKTFNPNWHELWNQELGLSLAPPRSIFIRLKLTRLMSIFTSKKVWKFLIKIQLTKSDPKKTGGGKCPPSCQLGYYKNKLLFYIDTIFMGILLFQRMVIKRTHRTLMIWQKIWLQSPLLGKNIRD